MNNLGQVGHGMLRALESLNKRKEDRIERLEKAIQETIDHIKDNSESLTNSDRELIDELNKVLENGK